jgi:hypothetical protein
MADDSPPVSAPNPILGSVAAAPPSVSGSTTSGSAALTTAQMRIHGAIKTQVGALWFMGVICGILALGGVAISFQCPTAADRVWSTIGPIILAAISGTVGFLAGEKSAQRED